MKEVDVVCALVVNRHNVLMGKRPPTSLRPDLWEYPGGKVEVGETFHQALMRELQEELGVEATVGRFITRCEFEWDVVARINLFHVLLPEQPLILNAHSDLTWVHPRYALDRLPMAPSSYMFYRAVSEFMGLDPGPIVPGKGPPPGDWREEVKRG